MWFGTEEGLCRDNGYNIKVYRPSDSGIAGVAGARVSSICEHTADEIWFGTQKGVYSVSKRTRKVSIVDPEVLGNMEIICLKSSSDGSTWVSTVAGIMRYDSNGVLKKEYRPSYKGTPATGMKFYEDSHKTLWMIVRDGGICRYDKISDEWQEYPWPYKEPAFCMVEERNSGCLYVGTWLRGIVRFNPESEDKDSMFANVTQVMKNDERQGAIIALEQDDHKGLIWAATMRGLDVFEVSDDGGLKPVEVLQRRLPMYQMVTDLKKDSDGSIWVAGYNIPSFVVSPVSRVKSIQLPEVTRQSGHIATISSVCHDSSDPSLLWVFQVRHRLYLYDMEKGIAISDVENLFEDTNNNIGNITQLSIASKGGVWAVCHSPEMIYRLESAGGKIAVSEQVMLPADAGVIQCIYDAKNGTTYIGAGGGLLAYDGERTYWVERGNRINAVSGHGSELYVIRSIPWKGGSEVAVYRGNSLEKVVSMKYDLTSIAVSGTGGVVWVGDSRGEVLKLGKDSRYSSLSRISEYVPSGSVQSLLQDSCGNLWIQTEQHLTEVDLLGKRITCFDAGDPAIGLFNFFAGSSTILPSGELLFGGTGGLCKFSIGGNAPVGRSKKLTVTDITVDGEPAELPADGASLDLPADCQSVSIEFAIPDPFNASRMVYAYRLDGDGEWIQLPQGYNVVHLSRLPKGEHDFEVRRVVWGESDSSASEIHLKIVRQPKIYETWWFLCFVIIIFIIAGILLFRRWGRRKAEHESRKMEEKLIRLKFNFFTNITHELRTPLSLILTPLDSLINKEQNPDSKIELEGIRRNAEDLMSLINRILNFRRLEVGGEKLNATRGNLVEFVNQVADNFTTLASKKGIKFSVSFSCTTLMADFDAEKFKIILNNLLGNAFKFTERGGAVQLSLDTMFDNDGTKAVLKISDNGKGIPRNHIPHILEAFYQVGDSVAADGTAGSGIGLYLVKEYVDMHGGKINIRSKENSGTEIVVTLPLGAEVPVGESEPEQELFSRNPDRQLILVIEDNDEFRAFLRRELGNKYDVIEASDGDSGLKLVHKHYPDLIVSDVMMPRMSGFELCRKVKTDPAVCDIPVILLTARIDEASRMEGFENKADSYITKPFKLEMLFNRIEHLTESRRHRQNEFRKEPETSPEKLELNPLDEALLQKVIACVTENIDNSGYSIADLSSDMNMSRMNLYRKIMAITGQSPTDFVRTLRLKYAAKMLLEGTHSIVEIADATGFSSPSYFTRIFKSHFGKTPSQYADGLYR